MSRNLRLAREALGDAGRMLTVARLGIGECRRLQHENAPGGWGRYDWGLLRDEMREAGRAHRLVRSYLREAARLIRAARGGRS